MEKTLWFGSSTKGILYRFLIVAKKPYTDYFGNGAADTWMEGDISLSENLELGLHFVSLKKVAG
jgi:hypothetical protein